MLKTHCLKRLMTVDSNMKVEEVHKDGDHEDMDAQRCRKLGMMCLVLPWTRRKSDGRSSRRSSGSKTRRSRQEAPRRGTRS